MYNPGRGHCETMNWILRYIKGSINVALVFEKDTTGKKECTEYVDSDYVGDLDKCQSRMEYIFTLAQASMSWHSTLQSIVILSTMTAEYIAMIEAMKEAILL